MVVPTIFGQVFSPKYFEHFSCAASRCQDPCCKVGWEIPLDLESAEKYRKSVENFSETVAEDGFGGLSFKLRPDGSCLHFDSDGLCGLMKKTGEQCEICSKYPRFFEEYDGFTEAGLSVSCPTAERLILDGDFPYEGIENRTTDDRLLKFLVEARAMAMEMVENEPDPDLAADRLCSFSEGLQILIDYDELNMLRASESDGAETLPEADYREFIDKIRQIIFEKTEKLSPVWEKLTDPKRPMSKAFAGTKAERRAYLEYLIYRRFLKAVSSEFIYAECLFIRALYGLAAGLSEDYFLNVRLISREIEHNDENRETLRGYITDMLEGWDGASASTP